MSYESFKQIMSECIEGLGMTLNKWPSLENYDQKLLAHLIGSPETSIFKNKTCAKADYLCCCLDLSIGSGHYKII